MASMSKSHMKSNNSRSSHAAAAGSESEMFERYSNVGSNKSKGGAKSNKNSSDHHQQAAQS